MLAESNKVHNIQMHSSLSHTLARTHAHTQAPSAGHSESLLPGIICIGLQDELLAAIVLNSEGSRHHVAHDNGLATASLQSHMGARRARAWPGQLEVIVDQLQVSSQQVDG